MVLINEKKYACATCIKGHRVSGCTHTDRPLFEVKKKGRPSTQCQFCRDKRKGKSVVHTKCACGEPKVEPTTESAPVGPSTTAVVEKEEAGSSPGSSAEVETRKGVPGTTPIFPNGLKDVHELAAAAEVLTGLGGEAIVAPERKLSSLLNPCHCKSTGICRCCGPKRDRPASPSRRSRSSDPMHAHVTDSVIEMFKSRAVTPSLPSFSPDPAAHPYSHPHPNSHPHSHAHATPSLAPINTSGSITPIGGRPAFLSSGSLNTSYLSPENMFHPAHTSPHVHKTKLYSPYSTNGHSTPRHGSKRTDPLTMNGTAGVGGSGSGVARASSSAGHRTTSPVVPKIRPLVDMNQFLNAVFNDDGTVAREVSRSALGLPGIRSFDATAAGAPVPLASSSVASDVPGAAANESHEGGEPASESHSSSAAASGGGCCSSSGDDDDSADMDVDERFVSFPTAEEVIIGACACGEGCECPGCATHGNPSSSSPANQDPNNGGGSAHSHGHHEGCGDSCKSSFDCSHQVSIPSGVSSIEQLIAMAASQVPGNPHPPPRRDLDPFDTRVLPPAVQVNEDAARHVGLVPLLPLQCCNGRCQCKPGECTCEKDCCGCCVKCSCDEDGDATMADGEQGGEPAKSCCGGGGVATSGPEATQVEPSPTSLAVMLQQPQSVSPASASVPRPPSSTNSGTSTPVTPSSSTLPLHHTQPQPHGSGSSAPPLRRAPSVSRAKEASNAAPSATASGSGTGSRRVSVSSSHQPGTVQRSTSVGKASTKAIALHSSNHLHHPRPILPKPSSAGGAARSLNSAQSQGGQAKPPTRQASGSPAVGSVQHSRTGSPAFSASMGLPQQGQQDPGAPGPDQAPQSPIAMSDGMQPDMSAVVNAMWLALSNGSLDLGATTDTGNVSASSAANDGGINSETADGGAGIDLNSTASAFPTEGTLDLNQIDNDWLASFMNQLVSTNPELSGTLGSMGIEDLGIPTSTSDGINGDVFNSSFTAPSFGFGRAVEESSEQGTDHQKPSQQPQLSQPQPQPIPPSTLGDYSNLIANATNNAPGNAPGNNPDTIDTSSVDLANLIADAMKNPSFAESVMNLDRFKPSDDIASVLARRQLPHEDFNYHFSLPTELHGDGLLQDSDARFLAMQEQQQQQRQFQPESMGSETQNQVQGEEKTRISYAKYYSFDTSLPAPPTNTFGPMGSHASLPHPIRRPVSPPTAPSPPPPVPRTPEALITGSAPLGPASGRRTGSGSAPAGMGNGAQDQPEPVPRPVTPRSLSQLMMAYTDAYLPQQRQQPNGSSDEVDGVTLVPSQHFPGLQIQPNQQMPQVPQQQSQPPQPQSQPPAQVQPQAPTFPGSMVNPDLIDLSKPLNPSDVDRILQALLKQQRMQNPSGTAQPSQSNQPAPTQPQSQVQSQMQSQPQPQPQPQPQHRSGSSVQIGSNNPAPPTADINMTSFNLVSSLNQPMADLDMSGAGVGVGMGMGLGGLGSGSGSVGETRDPFDEYVYDPTESFGIGGRPGGGTSSGGGGSGIEVESGIGSVGAAHSAVSGGPAPASGVGTGHAEFGDSHPEGGEMRVGGVAGFTPDDGWRLNMLGKVGRTCPNSWQAEM